MWAATVSDQQIRTKLERERERLLGLRAELEREAIPTEDEAGELSAVDQHPADVGTEMFERTKDLSIIGRIDGELEDVERAFARLDSGAYGTCEACGHPIDPARLEAKPAARFCYDDQQAAERAARGTPDT